MKGNVDLLGERKRPPNSRFERLNQKAPGFAGAFVTRLDHSRKRELEIVSR